MKPVKTLIIGAALLASTSVVSISAMAKDIVVGVSWNNFQEERWKTDEAAIKAALDAVGREVHLDRRAGRPTKQLADVDSLIIQGANVLIILAQDWNAIMPAVKKALDAGIPVIAYDRLIERSERALHHLRQRPRRPAAGRGAPRRPRPQATTSSSRATRPTPNADFLRSGIVRGC